MALYVLCIHSHILVSTSVVPAETLMIRIEFERSIIKIHSIIGAITGKIVVVQDVYVIGVPVAIDPL